MESQDNRSLVIESKKQNIDALSEAQEQYLLTNLDNLEYICLKGNSYSKIFFSSFATKLQQANSLKRFNANDIFVGRGKEEIPQSLSSLSGGLIGRQIVTLDLSNNAINPFGAAAIRPFLEQATSLKTFLINNCGLGIQGVTQIAQGLRLGTPNLQIFAIARNRAEDEGAQQISISLNKLQNLKELHIYQNGIKEAGMIQLLDSLTQNCIKLELLDIRDNFIHMNTSPVLAHLISTSTELKALNISDCNIETSFNEHILGSLENSKNKFIKIGYNYAELNDSQGIRLFGILQKSIDTLERVDVKGNNFKAATKTKFRQLLNKEKQLSAFDSDEEEESALTFDELAREFSTIHI